MPEQPSPSPFPDDVVEGMAKARHEAFRNACMDGFVLKWDDLHSAVKADHVNFMRAALAFLQKHYVRREVLETEIDRAYRRGNLDNAESSRQLVIDAEHYAAARLKEIFG